MRSKRTRRSTRRRNTRRVSKRKRNTRRVSKRKRNTRRVSKRKRNTRKNIKGGISSQDFYSEKILNRIFTTDPKPSSLVAEKIESLSINYDDKQQELLYLFIDQSMVDFIEKNERGPSDSTESDQIINDGIIRYIVEIKKNQQPTTYGASKKILREYIENLYGPVEAALLPEVAQGNIFFLIDLENRYQNPTSIVLGARKFIPWGYKELSIATLSELKGFIGPDGVAAAATAAATAAAAAAAAAEEMSREF